MRGQIQDECMSEPMHGSWEERVARTEDEPHAEDMSDKLAARAHARTARHPRCDACPGLGLRGALPLHGSPGSDPQDGLVPARERGSPVACGPAFTIVGGLPARKWALVQARRLRG